MTYFSLNKVAENDIKLTLYYFEGKILCKELSYFKFFLYFPGVTPLCFLKSLERWLSSLNWSS